MCAQSVYIYENGGLPASSESFNVDQEEKNRIENESENFSLCFEFSQSFDFLRRL